MDPEALQKLEEVLNYYDILESVNLDEKINQKLYLGKQHTNCRFCGESFPQVHFENDAHALPEFIGNRYLVSHYECDSCNKGFGETIETDMANFMCVSHLSSGVEGKGGKISKYQRSGITLVSSGKHIEVKNLDWSNINDKQFTISLTNPAFVPIAVYKCLTKMALTLMPEEELPHFLDTFKWIREKQHKNSPYIFNSLISIHTYSAIRFPSISAILLRRKEDVHDNIPYIIFKLTYANFSFQTYIPLCSLDEVRSYRGEELFYVPTLAEITNGLMTSEKHYVDLNVADKVKSDMTSLEVNNLDN